MKKVFAIFAIAGLIATASCGNKTTEETSTEATEVVEETTEEVVEEAEVAVDSAAVVEEEVK